MKIKKLRKLQDKQNNIMNELMDVCCNSCKQTGAFIGRKGDGDFWVNLFICRDCFLDSVKESEYHIVKRSRYHCLAVMVCVDRKNSTVIHKHEWKSLHLLESEGSITLL